MEYNFTEIEQSWKQFWKENKTYQVLNESAQPKYYVLDMFPYPSGAGLHVGHPLGYIASDIYARFKKMKGFNVLHPMGFDAFGLPAEQYALETGQHPAVTTDQNITRYKEQLDNIGFSYDWDREVRTSEPGYYCWTQWIFLQLFKSWFNTSNNKAEYIDALIEIFKNEGNAQHQAPGDETLQFTAAQWNAFSEIEQRNVLMQYRLAYLDYAEVWWCEGLGTVLANDEVVNGRSERGGFSVEKKKMRQWFLRITDYADRLLSSLDNLDWSDAMKEMQRNWIGKSIGASVHFTIDGVNQEVEVFTTRPDTIFGVDFMVLAPELELVKSITTAAQKQEVEEYIAYVKSRSERERMAEKRITGCFTGAYVQHPFLDKKVPVWISEYVLAGYGTGAIMAVPAGDERDFAFAKHFNLPVTNIFGDKFNGAEALSDKTATIENSGFLSGLSVKDAIDKAVAALEEKQIGRRKINYRMRDAGFSRQRYWGEPFPIVYVGETPYAIDEKAANLTQADQQLPVLLPNVDSYQPGPNGEGPLANIESFVNVTNANGDILNRETNTMPGYAGSSWYFLRYMDPHDDEAFVNKNVSDYWNQVDLYIGGTEHAVGHLLYSRLWTKVLADLGHLSFDEPFKRLVNQGMIQGSSRFVYRLKDSNTFISEGIINGREVDKLHVYIGLVNGVELDTNAFKNWRPAYSDATFELENGKYICGVETEKMSKTKYNVVNPDEIVLQYGADTFRMYEMFLGPIEISKPWDTKGIEGVHRFIKKLWRLYQDESQWLVTDEAATAEELKTLHKTIKKITEDTEHFSFNTAVSQLMICVNELTAFNCHKRAVLDPLARLIGPYAPHLAEELWHQLGHNDAVVIAPFPIFDEKYVVESSKIYPIAINGKARTTLEFALDATEDEIKAKVLSNDIVVKWLEGKEPKKFLYIKGKMINVVI